MPGIDYHFLTQPDCNLVTILTYLHCSREWPNNIYLFHNKNILALQVLRFSLWCNWDFCLLGSDAALAGHCFPTFRRNVLPSFLGIKWTKKRFQTGISDKDIYIYHIVNQGHRTSLKSKSHLKILGARRGHKASSMLSIHKLPAPPFKM